jgi:hypothetical protein
MNRGRERRWTRTSLLTHAAAVLLATVLIATPQAMSWFCSWDGVGVGAQAMPEVEEDVKEESARIAEEVSESRLAASDSEKSSHPSPSDDAALPSRHAQVAVPPPEAC